MFDLHMHTNLSDGELSVIELLSRLKEKNIELFSITDHNHALAYNYIEDTLQMKMIKGSEITTSYEGVVIEILGYNINPTIINNWYNDFYSEENMIRNEIKLFSELKDISRKNGFKISDNLEMDKIIKGESKKAIYYYLKETYPDFIYPSYKVFFRTALSNPKSDFFIDEGRYYPSISEVIELIHKANGVAILAHPYEYGISEIEELYEYLIDLGIDGIECFHPSMSINQSIKTAKYCCKHNLLGSGGSDFHRDNRLISHGVRAHKDLLDMECFDWFNKSDDN